MTSKVFAVVNWCMVSISQIKVISTQLARKPVQKTILSHLTLRKSIEAAPKWRI